MSKDEQLLGALRRAITAAVTGDIRLAIAAMEFSPEHRRVFDPVATVIEWLSVCRTRNLDRLMTLYDAAAVLDCACTGQKLCSGKNELQAYWQKRLADPAPTTFTLQDVWPSSDATVLDYISHNGQLVRSFFQFADSGLIVHTKCGPIELAKAS